MAGGVIIINTWNDNSLTTGRKVAETAVTASPWVVEALAASGVISTGTTPVGWVAAGVGLIGTTGLMVYDGISWLIEKTAEASVQFENAVSNGWPYRR